MPRSKHIHLPGAFYFVSTAVNAGNRLPKKSQDWQRLTHEVNDALARFEASAHAFCWTPAHLYLFVQIGRIPLGKILQRFKSNFALYQNKKTGSKGNWFEQRYDSKLVDENEYYRHVVRYIHLQPIALGLAKNLSEFPWSSHHAYLGEPAIARLKVRHALGQFDADVTKARAAYERFVKMPLLREGPFTNTLPPCNAIDSRILGSYEFSQRILARWLERLQGPSSAVAIAN